MSRGGDPGESYSLATIRCGCGILRQQLFRHELTSGEIQDYSFMRSFIIFFDEKSGTSPLVRLLDRFDLITVLHQEGNTGFEPFDRHNCGRMALSDLKHCLELIYDQGPRKTDELNRIYTRTAKRSLDVIGEKGVVGFKMRFTPPNPYPFHINRAPWWNSLFDQKFRQRFVGWNNHGDRRLIQ